jgi:hypothetical protein
MLSEESLAELREGKLIIVKLLGEGNFAKDGPGLTGEGKCAIVAGFPFAQERL